MILIYHPIFRIIAFIYLSHSVCSPFELHPLCSGNVNTFVWLEIFAKISSKSGTFATNFRENFECIVSI